MTISRCANNPLIGKPHKITTVDKYQGQQNDYILLSLVKTNNVGHLRDVRRLVVAMSRARLGKMNTSLFWYGTQIVMLTCNITYVVIHTHTHTHTHNIQKTVR